MKKSKENKKAKKIAFYALLLIAVIILILILVHYFFASFFSWKGHQNYIKNQDIQEIESWMTPYTILRHFNISETNLFQELNITKTKTNLRTPLNKICKKNKIDCEILVEKLNEMSKS